MKTALSRPIETETLDSLQQGSTKGAPQCELKGRLFKQSLDNVYESHRLTLV